MSANYEAWKKSGCEHGWKMPKRPSLFWRLPFIRHAWVMWVTWQVELHYRHGLGSIGIRTGYDEWVLYGMFWNYWPSDEKQT